MAITNENISQVMDILRKEIERFKHPIVQALARRNPDAFKILVATLLSARTKDTITAQVIDKLFEKVNGPEDLIKMSEDEIARLIYPIGFYRQKAKFLKELSKIILEKYNGKVPDTIEELVKLPGVGRKTANLVVILAFDKDGICVDTHVHRIVNRWQYVKTRTPEETEKALREKLPRKHWKEINRILVTFGQNICTPVNPKCEKCPINNLCPYGIQKLKN
ncbi:MAG: endonuclease III domain-containing protein [Candidatus Asgardarchaeia archaeon]